MAFEPLTPEQIQDCFTYHPPSTAGAERHQGLSLRFIEVADAVQAVCPEGREKSVAMTKLEEAKFWASAAVARNPETR